MKINKVTITGLDKASDIPYALELQRLYPFVEWGILFTGNKQGQARYPKDHVIEQIIKSGLNLSAHFCGVWSRNVLENDGYGSIATLNTSFKRVQLNYNFSHNEKWSMPRLIMFCQDNPAKTIILQYNKSNKSCIDSYAFTFPPNIHILYDASGGRGTEISTIEAPYSVFYTGYAGGISDQNIEKICEKVHGHPDESNVWIDMESGVRTDDQLNMGKVADVLQIVWENFYSPSILTPCMKVVNHCK